MKLINLMMILLALAFAGCKANVTADDTGLRATQSSWPRYESKALSGSLFGSVWLAKTAVARADVSSPSTLVVELYGENVPNACEYHAATSTQPYATVIIPKAYAMTEYQDNPLTFGVNGASTRNMLAKRTSLRVEAISTQGFVASITADGIDEAGVVSDMNGQINVTDCTRLVPFTTWEKLAGDYSLYSFDGVAQDMRFTRIKLDQSSFLDKSSQTYMKAIIFPLYYSVSSNSDTSYNFGPIANIGKTEMIASGQKTTYTYHYDGPLNFRGMDVTLKLDMTVVQNLNELEVNYTIEVPNQVSRTNHNFILKK